MHRVMEPTSSTPDAALMPVTQPADRTSRDGRLRAGLLGLVAGLLIGALGMYLAVGREDSETLQPAAAAETTAPVATDAPTTTVPVTVVPMGGTCTDERRVLEVAFEAYFAENGEDADSFSVLLGTFLRDDPSARWTFTPGAPPTIVGIGICTGF
jgi:hypothetical protein